jgi:PAS domain S-box-containing protein
MTHTVQVLVVEDRPEDAELMIAELRRSGYSPQWERVDNERQFVDAVAASLEVILADYSLPGFNAPRLLEIVRERSLNVPVIIVSGSIGEEVAVEMMQRGAADYVLKDRLQRLGLAVTRALDQRRLQLDKRSAEESLRASEERLRLALDGGHMGLWQWDLRTGRSIWNAREYELLGLPVGDGNVAGELFFKYIHPADVGRVRGEVERCMESVADLDTEMRIVRADGENRWLVSRGRVYRDAAARPAQFIGVNYDVTERKRAEAAVRASQHMLETVMNNIPQGVFWKDRNSVYLGCNRVVLQARGFDRPEQIVGQTDFDLPGLEPEDAALLVQKDREVMDSGQPMLGIVEPMNLADGSTIWLESSKLPMHDAEGRIVGILGTWQDITERRRLEEQLRQSQKMEAIGQLAGGVAHDFNNLLTVILGCSELAMASLPAAAKEARDHVAAMRDAGERAAALTRQLLAFSRKQLLEPKVLDLNDVVAGSEKMLRRLIGEDIVLATVLDSALPKVRVDPSQIEQVILNLVVNARDAMPAGGNLRIETRVDVLPSLPSNGHEESPSGPYVRLSVRDTGCGISPEVQPRIFDPFFTTKGPGRGTGLGLAMVYGIVKQSGGWIDVTSEVGAGTTFDVYLPAIEAERGASPAQHPTSSAEGRETILLVEDDAAVRVLTREALERFGYRVLEAEGGREALSVAAAHQGAIELLITDIKMPEVGGRELAETLVAQRNDLKVLYVSGYTEDTVLRHGIAEATSAFLQKPFTLLALAKRAREILDERG